MRSYQTCRALTQRVGHRALTNAASSTKLNLTAPSFLTNPDNNTKSALTFNTGTVLAPPTVPVKIRGRYGLPGALCKVTNPLLPETLADPKEGFPAVLNAKSSASDSAYDWARALKPHLDKLLPQSGVVVVDGLGHCLENAERYTQFMEAMKSEYACTKFMQGRSMTSTQVTELVRTGSDDHAAYTIEPHNEYNVAAKDRPRKLFLLCSEEPTEGMLFRYTLF